MKKSLLSFITEKVVARHLKYVAELIVARDPFCPVDDKMEKSFSGWGFAFAFRLPCWSLRARLDCLTKPSDISHLTKSMHIFFPFLSKIY